jgi:hypothetical protein
MTTQSNLAATAVPAVPPDVQILQLVGGAFISQAVYVAAKLGIADLLADGPKTAKYLAENTQTGERSLYRVLRSLASVGAFVESDGKTFANTPMTETLRSDVPNSTRDTTIWMAEEEHWRVYGSLLYSVQTGKPAWDKVHGEPVFPYLFETNKPLGEIFNRAMTSFSYNSINGVLSSYDFSGAGTIADIAGGHGHLLAAVLAKYENSKGVLFDLPPVLAGAPEMLESYGVTGRGELIEGNFFEDIPVVADVYLMKHIMHDWYDDDCEKILQNIREAMPDNARVLILDAVIPEGNGPHFGKIIDLEMLLSPGGVERTATEFEQLLERSGFALNQIIETPSPVAIVEAVKAK